jgi:hypothetical protein
MNALSRRNIVASIVMSMLFPFGAANAQLDDLLKHGGSSGASSAKGLGAAGDALSGHSVTAGSTGNVAGVLEYCLKNNFLGGNDATSTKDKLMGKLGGSTSSDKGYKEGSQGLLHSSDGKQLNLGAIGGMKSEITKQVCDQILAQGKSLL